MPDTAVIQVRRALLSVSDKTGLIDFARGLHDLGVELVSTGGTFRALNEAGLPAIEVSSQTQKKRTMTRLRTSILVDLRWFGLQPKIINLSGS